MFYKGQEFIQKFTVDSTVYEGFIILFKDKNPLHTDENFAHSKKFESKVMHGNILNGFLSFFIGECLPTKDVIIQTQDIKYSLPVYLNDELEFKAIVDEYYESVNTVDFKYFFMNKFGKKVARGKIQIGII